MLTPCQPIMSIMQSLKCCKKITLNFHLITDLSLAHDAFTAHLFMQEQCNQHLIKTIQYLFNCCTHQKLAEKVNTRVTLINS